MDNVFSFWKLLTDYKIEIPKIQRGYAQGRAIPKIEKDIVLPFLENLKKSLMEKQKMNLDFVYGKTNNTGIKKVILLDGQQRLTTLFLLHWYLAIKENKLIDNKDILKKFTYETRPTTTDFCRNLVTESIEYSILDKNKISHTLSNTIRDCNWYFMVWKKDATIESMLHMLDLIHQKFNDIDEELFDTLISEKFITFNFLPLNDFNLTDEIYIKMNARGKPLTKFENFKSKFAELLDDIRIKGKLDNEWMNIFWKLQKNNIDLVDDSYYKFFEVCTLNFYTEINTLEESQLNSYDLFDIYNEVYLDKKYLNQIIIILDRLCDYDDDKLVINALFQIKDKTNNPPDYARKLYFYAICKYLFLIKSNDDINKVLYFKWLRVIYNLIDNTVIDGTDDFQKALISINDLSKHIDNIYEYISNAPGTIKYFLKSQREEESIKAQLIINDSDWEDKLVKVERHIYSDGTQGYFNGHIGFVLKYSLLDDGSYDMNSFEKYAKKLLLLFGSDFKDANNFLFQRALLAKGDYLVDINRNRTFCTFSDSIRINTYGWYKVFDEEKPSKILKLLLDDISNDKMEESLLKVIEQYLADSNNLLKDWRRIIIKNPEDITYCESNFIRYTPHYYDINSNLSKIYLLSKTQMNGRHKDLFSWNFFRNILINEKYLSFSLEYQDSISWEPSNIVLKDYYYNDKCYYFHMFLTFKDYEPNYYQIIDKNDSSPWKELINNDYKNIKEEDVVRKLKELDKLLLDLQVKS
ncbi:DUF262 domain-containing protein [Clostridium sp.]|uniref:DUF262 domain-containing protein n=1 Tax=Clostridium sp. TaxID=1506 RepID=UPI001A499BDD|nr:DUF262 domain-containing protein [Clostridium sp.]MBK5236308.1 DUF262 domain-containing protein [Clostridium sp.]